LKAALAALAALAVVIVGIGRIEVLLTLLLCWIDLPYTDN
tara:strand:- start:1561 stop:1680 length:120 start_codon:yes stop_codon:yes gene_type:complete